MGKQDFSVKNNIKLSDRLHALADMVSAGNRLADIGTDHSYIPIWLCINERIPSALAMDVRVGPLFRAETHIREYGLTDRIQTRLSDGLENLGENEADTVLIAGMGGRLMLRILSETAVPESVAELVLQPQSDIFLIRRWVREHGFRIAEEDMIEEEGKYYPMMKAVRTESVSESGDVRNGGGPAALVLPDEQRTKLEDQFGPVLLNKRHPVLRRWLEKELKTTENIIVQLEKNSERNSKSMFIRRQELLQKKAALLNALKCYQ